MDKPQTIHDNLWDNETNNRPIRLTVTEQQVIRDSCLRWFGVRPRLFGSRVDTGKCGGDIDLYIEVKTNALPPSALIEARLHTLADIWSKLGERKIDMVINDGGEFLPIYAIAQQEGVWL